MQGSLKNLTYLGIYLTTFNKGIFISTFLKVCKIFVFNSSIFLFLGINWFDFDIKEKENKKKNFKKKMS